MIRYLWQATFELLNHHTQDFQLSDGHCRFEVLERFPEFIKIYMFYELKLISWDFSERLEIMGRISQVVWREAVAGLPVKQGPRGMKAIFISLMKIQESLGLEIKTEGLLVIRDGALREGHLRALEGGRRCQNYSIWSYDQNYAYITYLSNFKWAFVDEFSRKKYQVYMHMSRFLKTRNHNQIKSHHQKMIMKYGDIDRAIKGIAQLTMELIQKIPEIMEIILEINSKFQTFYDVQGNLRDKSSITKSKPSKHRVKRTIKQSEAVAPKQDTPVKMEEMDMPYIYYTLQEIPRDTFLKVEENYDSVRRETYD